MYVTPLKRISDGLIVSILGSNDSCIGHIELTYTNFEDICSQAFTAKHIGGVKSCDDSCENEREIPQDLKIKGLLSLSESLELIILRAVEQMTFQSKYDYLNDPDKVDGEMHIHISLDDLAERIVELNYGSVRFLAALVRARSRSTNDYSDSELSKIIKEALDKGLF